MTAVLVVLAVALVMLGTACLVGRWIKDRADEWERENFPRDTAQSMSEWLGETDPEFGLNPTTKTFESQGNNLLLVPSGWCAPTEHIYPLPDADSINQYGEVEDDPALYGEDEVPTLDEWLQYTHIHIGGDCVKRRRGYGPCDWDDEPIAFDWQPGPGLMKELPHIHVKGKCVKRRHGEGPCSPRR
jgi:hypothetical protein